MADGGGERVDLGIPGLGPAVLVGRGGFGLVYRATQVRTGSEVAVKVAQGHLDPAASIRFEREAEALGSLRGHPNICTVYDAGVDPTGRPYLVMELAPSSLADRIAAEGPLPWEEAAALGVRLAGAMETAHRAGLLHRDVKPENILQTTFREWRLADFGLARRGDETLSGNVTATLSHAAPELIEGVPPSVASDVYALGSTLFVALTGKPAFSLQPDAHQASIYRRIAEEPVPDMPGTPHDVAEVVRRAMAKAPADRYASAAEMGRALQEAQATAGVAVTLLHLPSGDSRPEPASPRDPELTVDNRTPHKAGDHTEALQRGGRDLPPTDEEPPEETTSRGRPNRRALLTVGAGVGVVALLAAAMTMRGDDGGGGGAGSASTDSPGVPDHEIRLADEWRSVQSRTEQCEGADGGPCPLPGEFELFFSTDCAPVAVAGGFGRSANQAAEDECRITLLGLDPAPLEFDGERGSAEIIATHAGVNLEMDTGVSCAGATEIDHNITFEVTDDEVRSGERLATELTGSLYVYFLSPPGVGSRCGSHYEFSFVMEALP